VIRLVQDVRKASGLEVADRIVLHLDGLDELAPDADFIGREVLAVKVILGPGSGEGTALELDGHPGARIWIEKA
jgi:hypothetical protein